ncbi:MAG: aldehyde ferredoxin oxidoreductase C-terminal domain-containing protein [Dehalococcoidia bacterium]
MEGAYAGKILRIDLTEERVTTEPLPPEDVLRKYVGCFGLGLKILYDELPVGIHPLDPRNMLIFMNGPLTGSGTPSGNNTTLVTLNYDTGYTAGRAHSHGFWGPNLRWAGYDGLIIQGAAKKPTYLWIHDGEVEFRDASKIWGKDTHESEDLVKEDLGESRASVAAIGPAGENMCAGGLIENDKNHTFAHAGGGSIMDSKKLKAIAVYGSKRTKVNVPEFKAARDEWLRLVKEGFIHGHCHNGRIPKIDHEVWNIMGVGMVYKNYQSCDLPEFGVGLSKSKITGRSCFACPTACSYDAEITTGPYKGHVATLCGGAEALEAGSAVVGITEPGCILYFADLMDRLGIEASVMGATTGLAFECFEKGLLTKEQTGGLELKWGDATANETLMKMIAHREGIGDLLARGPATAADVIGGEAPNWVIRIKGNAGMNFHDWKSGPWGVLLGHLVGGGTGWSTFAADMVPDADCGWPEPSPRLTPVGKGREVFLTNRKHYWCDCIGTCFYALVPGGTVATSTQSINALTGWGFSNDDAFTVGERALNLERAFNVRHGLKPEDDYTTTQRMLAAPTDGPAKGVTMAPYLKGMVMDYYAECGWDEKTGKPWRHTLERLGMEDVARDLWG